MIILATPWSIPCATSSFALRRTTSSVSRVCPCLDQSQRIGEPTANAQPDSGLANASGPHV